MGEGGGEALSLFRFRLSPFPQKRLILRLETCLQVELKHFASGRFFHVFFGKRGRESGASRWGRLQEPEMKSERLRESLGRSFSPIAIWI